VKLNQNQTISPVHALIFQNLFACIEELAKQSIELPRKNEAFSNCKVVNPEAQKSLQFILDAKYQVASMSPEFAANVKRLWEDPGLQNTFKNRSKFQLNDSAEHFLNKVDELGKPTYLPTDQDIIRCRVRTTGIIETEFVIEHNRFKLLDVGGQRNERKKWIHCFEKVTAVIFVTDISCYDLMLYEDEKVNRMEESLNLFENICNSRWFRNVCPILFLNKSDLFRKKIEKVSLRILFPDYTGENTYEAGTAFLEKEFLKRYHEKKRIYVHITCGPDSHIHSIVFNAVKDIVVNAGLSKAGLI